jgi:ATP-dependent DNA ligase
LATSITKVPSGERWIHEIKFDGYRVQVHIKDAAVTVFNRRGNDWTKRFKKISDDAWHISSGSAIIDGEVVAPATDGPTDFSVLQSELKGRSTEIVMIAFDLRYLNNHDLRKLPLIDRKALLKKTIAETDIQFSEFRGRRRGIFKHACKTGLASSPRSAIANETWGRPIATIPPMPRELERSFFNALHPAILAGLFSNRPDNWSDPIFSALNRTRLCIYGKSA